MIHRTLRATTLVIALALLLVPGASAATAPGVASAVLRDSGGTIVGRALLAETGRGTVHVVVVTYGLTPGAHGLHVHAVGSCIGPDFVSAGGHFNPTSSTHPNHAGDLPNLMVRSSGFGFLHTTTTRFTLSGGNHSLFDGDGASIVVHANADDLHTDPSGNSGGRVACGVITRLDGGVRG